MINVKELSAKGDIDGLGAFIASGGDIRIENDYALSTASENGHREVVELLLANGCQATTNESAPLRWAIVGNQVEIAKILIENGADPCVRNNQPLRRAVGLMQVEMAKLLIENGANPWAEKGRIYSFLHSTYKKNRNAKIFDERVVKMEELMAKYKIIGQAEYTTFKNWGIPQLKFKDNAKFLFKAFIYAVDIEDFETVIEFLDILANHPEIVDGKMWRFYSIVLSIFDKAAVKHVGMFRDEKATRAVIVEMSKTVMVQ